MSDEVSWTRLPPDWRTQALSCATWTGDEVVDLIEEWLYMSPQGAARFDPQAFEAFVQEQADIVMSLQEPTPLTDLAKFMDMSTADHQRAAVVVALRRAYPQPTALDEVDSWLTDAADETAAAEDEPPPACGFCSQDKLLARLRGQLRTALAQATRYRRERYGLFFRAE